MSLFINGMSSKLNKAEVYSALVWIIAGATLSIYCLMGLFSTKIPGVEELVLFLSTLEGKYIYIAVFMAIFIEGLYLISSFFPGSTLVVIIALLSQLSGPLAFTFTMITIFVGWCLAGVVNIFLARTYRLKISKLQENSGLEVKDRIWTTWFPAFRANYEVAQIIEGANPKKVFLSSVRVKFWASMAAAICLLIIPLFIDINKLSNKEGYLSVAVIAGISFIVGFIKLRRSLRKN